MPTILRTGNLRFYFYSHEPNEPAHVHIDKGGATAKLWLHDLQFARYTGFTPVELRQIKRIVFEHQKQLKERRDAYFQQ